MPVTYGRTDGKWKIELYTFCWTRNRKQWKPGYIYPSLHKGECDDVNDENEGTNIWPFSIYMAKFLPEFHINREGVIVLLKKRNTAYFLGS